MSLLFRLLSMFYGRPKRILNRKQHVFSLMTNNPYYASRSFIYHNSYTKLSPDAEMKNIKALPTPSFKISATHTQSLKFSKIVSYIRKGYLNLSKFS